MLNIILEYLTNTRPFTFSVFGNVFLGSAIACLIITTLIRIFKKGVPSLYKNTLKQASSLLLIYGIVSMAFYFIRMQRIPYLSMRLWLWVWFTGFWILTAIKLYKELKKIPTKKLNIKKHAKQRRYFEM